MANQSPPSYRNRPVPTAPDKIATGISPNLIQIKRSCAEKFAENAQRREVARVSISRRRPAAIAKNEAARFEDKREKHGPANQKLDLR
jgi:hypothetical protein